MEPGRTGGRWLPDVCSCHVLAAGFRSERSPRVSDFGSDLHFCLQRNCSGSQGARGAGVFLANSAADLQGGRGRGHAKGARSGPLSGVTKPMGKEIKNHMGREINAASVLVIPIYIYICIC